MGRRIADNGRMFFYSKVMKKNIIRLVLACVLPLQVMAQQASKEEIISHIIGNSAGMQSIACDFVQTKSLNMLDDKMVSKGKMYYEQPGKLRWEYTSPHSMIFMLCGNTIVLKDECRIDSIDARKNRMYKEMAGFMLGSITGEYLLDEKSFDVSVVEEAGEWVVTLCPLRKSMKQVWVRLVLHFVRGGHAISRLEMLEPSGDRTDISFMNVEINVPLAAGIFDIA